MSQTSTFLYFAYGSNLLTARLVDRVPSARFIAKGWLANFAFLFDKISTKDGSVKANLMAAPGNRVAAFSDEETTLSIPEGAIETSFCALMPLTKPPFNTRRCD